MTLEPNLAMQAIDHHETCTLSNKTIIAEVERAVLRTPATLASSMRWHPWVGEKYGCSERFGAKKLLIVGESHYEWCSRCWMEQRNRSSDLTCRCVAERIVSKDTIAHWKITEYAVTGMKFDDNANERAAFWHSVAYYNFVQDIVGYVGDDGARPRPKRKMWTDSKDAFRSVVETLKPGLMIILGYVLWTKLPEEGPDGTLHSLRFDDKIIERCTYPVSDGQRVIACRVRHPAAGLGRTWYPALGEAINQVDGRH